MQPKIINKYFFKKKEEIQMDNCHFLNAHTSKDIKHVLETRYIFVKNF